MAKGESRFCQAFYLHNSSKKIFNGLKKDNYLKDYIDKPTIDFVEKLAYYKCELIALHPFYELNGRVTRMFIDMIVAYNGYQFIDYSNYNVSSKNNQTKKYIYSKNDKIETKKEDIRL